MTRSTFLQSASRRSRSRNARAEVRISARGYHLKGTFTRSTSCPLARSSRTSPAACLSAPPDANGTCALQTRMRAIRKKARVEVADSSLHARHRVVLRREEETRDRRERTLRRFRGKALRLGDGGPEVDRHAFE